MQIRSGTQAYVSTPFAGDIGDELAELQIHEQSEGRQIERRIEQSDDALAEEESNREIESLRSKANDVRMAGIVSGAIAMTEVVLQAASSLSSVDVAAARGGSGPGQGTRAGIWLKTGASAIETSSKISDGLFQGAEIADDARAKAHAEAAERANTAAKSARDVAAEAQSAIDQAVQSVGQIEQTVATTRLAVAQRV